MNKINFQNLPSTSTPINATNLNQVQTNVDNAKLEKTIVVTATNQDLNNYRTEGRYYFNVGNAPTNRPAGTNGELEVMIGGSGLCKQIWYRHGTADTNDYETYVRTSTDGSTWSSWRRYAMVGADDIICRSATATFANETTSGSSHVSITATVPSGYKFLCWVGVGSDGWVSKGLYLANNKAITTDVWTGNPVQNPRTVLGFYLCIKNA